MVALLFAAAESVAAAAESMAAAAGTNSTAEGMPDAREELRHLTSFIVPFTIVAFIITLAQRFLKGAMPSMVLNGLLFVTLKQQNAPLAQPANSKKQEKKKQHLKAAQASSASMAWSTVSPGLLERLEMTEEFDLLLLGCVVFAVNAVFAVASKQWLYAIVAPFYLSLTLTGFGFVGSLMQKVEWSHIAIVRSEKLSMLFVGIFSASCSFWLLMYAPRSLHAFDTQASSVELVGRIQSLLTARARGIAAWLNFELPEAPPEPSALALALPLSLCAGLLSALLMAPGLRYGRVLQGYLKPPLWARNFAGKVNFMQLLVRAGYLAQMLMLPLWVPPLTDALLIPADVLNHLRGCSMLLVVGLQLLALRELVQAHLLIAPFKADIIHNMLALDAPIKADLTRRHLSRTLAELCKVALQLAFLPSLLLLCGSLYMLMGFPSPLAASHPKATNWDKEPSVLYQTVAGFLGWWATATYVGWATIGVVLSRAQGGVD